MSLLPLRLSPHAYVLNFLDQKVAKKNGTSIIMCAMEWACHLLARARSVPTKVCYQLWMGTVHGGNNGVLTFPKVLKCQSSQFGMHGQSLSWPGHESSCGLLEACIDLGHVGSLFGKVQLACW